MPLTSRAFLPRWTAFLAFSLLIGLSGLAFVPDGTARAAAPVTGTPDLWDTIPEPLPTDALPSPGFPRIAVYLRLSIDGHQINSDDEAGRVSRYQCAVIPASPATENFPLRLEQIRALNPNIRLLAYFPADFMWNGDLYPHGNIYGECWKMFKNHDWWVYGTDNQPFNYFGYTFDLTNPVAQDSLVDLLYRRVLSTGLWDGIFLDDFCESIWWKQQYNGQFLDLDRNGLPDAQATFDPLWKTGTDLVAQKLRARMGSLPAFVGNCAYGSKWAIMNGWMREDFPFQGSWTSNMFSPSGGYMVNEALYVAPHFNMIYTTSQPLPQALQAPNVTFLRYCLGSTMLGDGYFMCDDRNESVDQTLFWLDEFHGGRGHNGYMGRALGPYYQQIGDLGTTNQLVNGGFEATFDPWTPYNLAGTWTLDSTSWTEGRSCAHATIALSTAYSSGVHLRQTLTLASRSWAITFWARSTRSRTMWVWVQRTTGPMTIVCNQPLSLTTEWKKYQVTFNNGYGGVPYMVQLQFGQQVGDVWVDDVKLQQGSSSVYRRDFENGTVLVNPSSSQVTATLGGVYYHLAGGQEPSVNDGSATSQVVLNPQNAILLTRDQAPLAGVEPLPGRADWLRARTLRSPDRGGLRFEVSLGRAARVVAGLYDASGRLLHALEDGPHGAGVLPIAWRPGRGFDAPAGVYFLRVTATSAAGSASSIVKAVLLK